MALEKTLAMILAGGEGRRLAPLTQERAKPAVPFGGRYRWVEVYPPGGTTGIALAPPREQDAVGVQTGISLTTDDIDATHAQLQASLLWPRPARRNRARSRCRARAAPS